MSNKILIARANSKNIFTEYKLREGVKVEELRKQGWVIKVELKL